MRSIDIPEGASRVHIKEKEDIPDYIPAYTGDKSHIYILDKNGKALIMIRVKESGQVGLTFPEEGIP